MNTRQVTFNQNLLLFNQRTAFSKTKYDPHNCEICKIACNSKIMYDTHLEGKKHKRELQRMTLRRFFCDICDEFCETYMVWENHIVSRAHKVIEQKSFASRLTSVENERRSIHDRLLKCDVCDLDCKSNIILQSHLTGSKHKKKLKMMKIEELIDSNDPSVFCQQCNLYLVPELMVLHMQGSRHKKLDENKSIQKQKSNIECCVICDISFSSLKDAVEHYQSSEHSSNVKLKEGLIIWCDTCKMQFPNNDLLYEHLKGFKHYKILNKGNWKIEGTFKEKLRKKKELIKELKDTFRETKLFEEHEHIDES